jgi:hypothetical protein
MDKRRLHHIWTKLRLVKPWYLLSVALLSAIICVFALRANNQHMLSLRNAVYTADKNDTDVQGSLNRLQAYVTAHMNTNLSTGTSVYPPIQLKYTYDRLVQAQQSAAAAALGNTDLYTAAQHYCEQQDPVDFSGHNRVPCIEQYVQSHGGGALPTNPNIPDSLYKFAFVSPRWSPDLAGWTMLIATLSLILAIVTFAVDRWFRRTV